MNGRRDVCQLTDQKAVGPLQMHPGAQRPSLCRSPSLPPDEWGPLRYQLCHHCRGRSKSSSFLSLSKPESATLHLMIMLAFSVASLILCPFYIEKNI